VVLGCALLALGYALAIGPWRRRLGAGTPTPEWGRATLFLLGLVTVLVSLNGPIHDWSDRYLFSAHMVQHLLLGQVFAPLILLGLPPWLVRRLLAGARVRALWDRLAGVPTGFVLYTVFFSLWHLPVFYDLMMRQHSIHIAMHLVFMGTAVLLWWPIVGGAAVTRPLSAPAQLLYLFLLSIPMMAVAALLVFAARPFYEWYALAPRLYELSPLDDQRMGALIMWIPGSLYCWAVMSVIYFRWAGREERAETDPLRITEGRFAPGGPGR
jgi:putative membrane protein